MNIVPTTGFVYKQIQVPVHNYIISEVIKLKKQ